MPRVEVGGSNFRSSIFDFRSSAMLFGSSADRCVHGGMGLLGALRVARGVSVLCRALVFKRVVVESFWDGLKYK